MVRNEKGLLQFDEKDVDRWLMAADEPQRTEEMTHSEKLADQMVQDVGRLDAPGRQKVRKELDRIEAPLTGRDAQDAAAGQAISGRYRGLRPIPFVYEHVSYEMAVFDDPAPERTKALAESMRQGLAQVLEEHMKRLFPMFVVEPAPIAAGGLRPCGVLAIDKAAAEVTDWKGVQVKLNCEPVALSETTEISCPEHGSFVVEENGGRHCAFLGCTWSWRKVEPPAASDYAYINQRQKQIAAGEG